MLLHEVITTEKGPFSYRVAGMGSRMFALLIGCGIVLLLGFAGACTLAVFDVARLGLGSGLVFLWRFVFMWGYFLFFEWLWHGQTPGKRVVGIRVIHVRGTALTFYQSAVRNIVRFVDALPVLYGLGFVIAVCN